MWSLFILAALVTQEVPQAPPELQSRVSATVTARPEFLELTLAAPVQLPNGRQVGASVRPAVSPEPWLVYSRGNLCQSVITHGPVPTDATDGWKVSITERSRTNTQVTVGITWLRMWERGRLVTSGSGGTNELTLQRNDRIALDMITRPAQPGVCAGTTKSLEIQVGRPAFAAAVPAGESPLDGLVDAELWLVHTAPNGTETVEKQTVRLINGAVGFGFRTAAIETADGPVHLELNGQLKAVQRENGSRGLWAGLTRLVTRQSTGGIAFASTTEATVDWLVPNDVQSFDMPPLQLFASAGRGGGGAGGRVIVPPPTGTVAAGGRSGSGTAAGGARAGGTGGGTAGAIIGARPAPGPNLLEGHRLSLRVRLSETR
jgi:hypothetical protein